MKPKKSEGGFKQIPAGPHPAILYSLVDLGTQEGTYQGKPSKPKRKIQMRFEMHGEDCKLDDGRPMSIGKSFTLSSSSKGNLRPFMEAWRSKAFTDDEFEAFDLRNMLGKPCVLTIVEDGDFMTINGISKLIAGMAPPVQHNLSIFLSLEQDDFVPAVYAQLSEKMQGLIAQSPEYKILTGQIVEPAAATSNAAATSADVPFDDDIPF